MLFCTSLVLTILAVLAVPASPFSSAESIASNNASLLWGPYRPGLYLGIRPRVPESLLMGMMWGRPEQGERYVRHTCEPDDRLAGYGWTAYDTRHGGTQTIQDQGNMINITTQFVKISEGHSEGNWALRIRGTPWENARAGRKTSIIFYVAMERMEECAECHLEAEVQKQGEGVDTIVKNVDIRIQHPVLGVAGIHIPMPPHEATAVNSISATEDMLWQAKSLFYNVLNGEAQSWVRKAVIPDDPGNGNMHFVQMVFQDAFEVDILYSSRAATRDMTSSELSSQLSYALNSFRARFSSVFAPKLPFNEDSYTSFSQSVLSNLLGGLGYFYGDTKVGESAASDYSESHSKFWEKLQMTAKPQSQGPYELLSHVPSRIKFPRGFLWDEGFHLLPVIDWDADLALEVLRSWLALMDDDGWIPREQIMGDEGRSRVPAIYVLQHPHIANPPTMFWVVSKYIDYLSGEAKYAGHDSEYLSKKEKSEELIKEIYPLLKRHYEWFRRTQSGDVEAHSVPQASLDEGYRWRGRSPQFNLASGLDDYPRTEPPDSSELHIDALCWVGVMASALIKIAESSYHTSDITTFQSHYKAIAHNIDALHWSSEKNAYCDARIWEEAHTYTCTLGYITLFPFITGFLGADHPHLNATLNLIRDPQHLWTPYGIRSLSPKSTRYGTGDDYWRSPIWININYLILTQLLSLATTSGPLQEYSRQIYVELRRNIVYAMYSSYKQTGYVWEQYNAVTGKGQGTQYFTGWSSLVVLIMAMPDLHSEEKDGVRERMGKWFDEVRGYRARVGFGGWNSEMWVVGIMLVVFLYVTRRRFASLWRGLRRY